MARTGTDLDWLEILLNNLEVDPDDCWLLTKYVNKNHRGYGELVINLGYGKSTIRRSPHRFSYEFFVGVIPDGYQVDHTCHDPEVCHAGDTCKHRRCVNPKHLKAVPRAINSSRQSRHRNGGNAEKTHCPKGHPYSLENTYIRPNGRRKCRRCNALREAEKRKS